MKRRAYRILGQLFHSFLSPSLETIAAQLMTVTFNSSPNEQKYQSHTQLIPGHGIPNPEPVNNFSRICTVFRIKFQFLDSAPKALHKLALDNTLALVSPPFALSCVPCITTEGPLAQQG